MKAVKKVFRKADHDKNDKNSTPSVRPASEAAMAVSAPTVVVHKSHIGFEEGTIKTINLPPEMKTLIDVLNAVLVSKGGGALTQEELLLLLSSDTRETETQTEDGDSEENESGSDSQDTLPEVEESIEVVMHENRETEHPHGDEESHQEAPEDSLDPQSNLQTSDLESILRSFDTETSQLLHLDLSDLDLDLPDLGPTQSPRSTLPPLELDPEFEAFLNSAEEDSNEVTKVSHDTDLVSRPKSSQVSEPSPDGTDSDLAQELQKLKQELEAARRSRDKAKSKKANLKKLLNEKDGEIQNQKNIAEEKTRELAFLSKRLDDWRRNEADSKVTGHSEETIKDLRAKLDSMADLVNGLKQERSQLEDENQKIQQDLLEVVQQVSGSLTQAEQLQSVLYELESVRLQNEELTQLRNDSQKIIQNLQQQLRERSKQEDFISDDKAQFDKLAKKFKELRELDKQTIIQLHETKEKLAAYKKENRELKTRIKSIIEKKKEFDETKKRVLVAEAERKKSRSTTSLDAKKKSNSANNLHTVSNTTSQPTRRPASKTNLVPDAIPPTQVKSEDFTRTKSSRGNSQSKTTPSGHKKTPSGGKTPPGENSVSTNTSTNTSPIRGKGDTISSTSTSQTPKRSTQKKRTEKGSRPPVRPSIGRAKKSRDGNPQGGDLARYLAAALADPTNDPEEERKRDELLNALAEQILTSRKHA